MKLPDLFALIFLNSPTDNTDGGGQFLLELSDASLKADKRGRGRNPLYGPFGTKPMPADKRAKLDSDTRQRWYSGGRPLTTGRAKYWASNFDHAALNDWLYKRWHPVGRIAEIRAILHNNGYEVSDGYAAIDKVVTLLKVGLENASHGIQIIDDKRWNPSISDATDAERARPLRQRFSELTPGDVVVRGDVLIVKGQEFQFSPVTGPTVKATGSTPSKCFWPSETSTRFLTLNDSEGKARSSAMSTQRCANSKMTQRPLITLMTSTLPGSATTEQTISNWSCRKHVWTVLKSSARSNTTCL